jgi:hypothetical protein
MILVVVDGTRTFGNFLSKTVFLKRILTSSQSLEHYSLIFLSFELVLRIISVSMSLSCSECYHLPRCLFSFSFWRPFCSDKLKTSAPKSGIGVRIGSDILNAD